VICNHTVGEFGQLYRFCLLAL